MGQDKQQEITQTEHLC